MTSPADGAALLAGFVLAHAVWNVSDLPNGELLVPFAVSEVENERSLERFEADTQEEAIAAGKAAMQGAMSTADSWAFARDGTMDRDGKEVDVLSVDFWSKGMPEPMTVIQEYQPPTKSSPFRLIGKPILVENGVAQSSAAAKSVLGQVLAGVRSHSKVAVLWNSWQ